jgi:hypothetical protein
LVAVNFGGGAYTSTNSGNTWTSSTGLPTNSSWYAASSADGTKLVVVARNGLIYSTTNSGANWNWNSLPAGTPSQQWHSAASSADGGKLVAVAANNTSGAIWTSHSPPATPQMNLAPANGNLTLSWTVPSTNFMMQQCSDLGGWKDMTNTPVLNLTNLQNEVILSPTNSSGFYRLKTP